MNIKVLTKFSSLIIIAAMVLAGCTTGITASANNDLSTATWLALGTLKLEGTSQAITSSQAAQLLALWQGYESLSNSDTASQVELDALVKQIEGSLTSDQVNAIEAMDLTGQSLSESLCALGGDATANLHAGNPSTSTQSQSNTGNGSSTMPSNGSAAIPSGGLGGEPPSASGGMPAGGDSSGVNDILNGASTQGTAVATQPASTTGTVQVNPMLLSAVIQLLETRSQSAG